jgi:signal transduction histidine kinase
MLDLPRCWWPDGGLFALSRTADAPVLARALADGAIALSSLAIAGTLAALASRLRAPRAAFPGPRRSQAPLLCAVAFLGLNALAHLLDAGAPWLSAPLLGDLLRAALATSAVVVAALLPRLAPRAAALGRAAQLAQERGLALEAAHRELDAAVARAKDLESQLFASVSHELRTPLALILGPAERLLAGPDLRDDQRADLEVVARNARTLLKHVGDLLHVARSEAGKLSASYSEVDLAELCRNTGAHFDGFAKDRKVAYTIVAASPIAAEVDAAKLQRVLLNLLANAFKFTPKGGRVRVAALELTGNRVAVEVADSGPGVPEAERQAVFERFHQREGGSTRRFGGTGLGLAIVKDLVALMGGAVTLGQAPEGGALLRVEMPSLAPPGAVVSSTEDSAVMMRSMVHEALDRLRSPSDPPSPALADTGLPSSPSVPPSFERPLVLVVEDNPDMNRFVAAALAPELRVVSAFDGEQGLAEALRLRPDLIVSDVMMPGLSGDALLAALRARPELDGTPVVVLTAKTDDVLRARLLREGAQDYLNKPFFAEELRARARNLVSMKRAREILQRDLSTRTRDLEALAGEVAQRRRELTTALESARVARDHADRASSMKTSFLRMVSHELRTPLTSLKLNLERLTRTAPAAPQDEMIRKIAASAGRLHELIESLLEYARIEGGRLRVEEADVDAETLCADVIEELSPQAEQKGIALRLARAARAVPPLRSDPRLLRLVVVNLVGNAVKFTHDGAVDVVVSHERGAHCIRVRDSGPGIPAQDHDRIFEPFEQMEPLPHKHTRGVGLGLSIVKEMVEALSGRIELRSAPGQGSTFTVVLPPREG